MEFYDKLLQETEANRNEFLAAPVVGDVLNRRFDLTIYTAFLIQAYHHVKHTVPLLMAAGARLPNRVGWLQNTLGHYIMEEMGHEAWILDDLEACGVPRSTIENGQPPLLSEVMVAYLYDLVNRGNPVGILGMVLVLEGTSVNLATEVATIVKETLGLPDSAVTYLSTHGDLDQDHMKFFEQAVNRLHCEEDQLAVIHSARITYKLYGDIYRSLNSSAQI